MAAPTEAPVTELVERDAELRATDAALADARAGRGRLLLIEAAAGVGKTALVGAAQARAARFGMRTLRARGHELESALSFGVVRQLFEPLLSRAQRDERRALLRGPAAAALALVSATASATVADSELELTHALFWLVSNLAAAAPALLAIDDLHWADGPSLRFLVYLEHRIADLPMAVVAAARPDWPPDTAELGERLAGGGSVAIARPAALSPAGSSRLVRTRFADATAAFCAACAEVSGGNPFLLEELLAEFAATGAAADDDGSVVVRGLAPESVVRSAAERLARLSPEARRVAETAAVLGDSAPLDVVKNLVDLDDDALARALDDLAHIRLTLGSDRISFAHPLLREAVYAGLPEADRRSRHAAAARIVFDSGRGAERVAAHLLQAPRVGAEWTVERLDEAATEALARGAATSAVAYVERALEEPAPPAACARLLTRLAHAEAALGRPSAIAHLNEALDAAPNAPDRAQTYGQLGELLFRVGRYEDARAALRRGVDELRDESGELGPWMRGRVTALEALLPGPGERVGAWLSQGDHDGSQPSPARRATAGHLANALIASVEPVQEARRLALFAVEDDTLGTTPELHMDFLVTGAALVWCDELAEVERVTDLALAAAESRNALLHATDIRFGRAWMHHHRAELSAAVESASTCVGTWSGSWSGQLAHARYWLAVSLCELDRVPDAQAVLAEPDTEAERAEPSAQVSLTAARVHVALAAGDAWAALRHFDLLDTRAREVPFFNNPTVLPWRSLGAVAALRVGDRERAQALADEELALARRFGAARGLGTALRAAGVVAGGEDGVASFEEAVAVLDGTEARLAHLHALVELGAALRRLRRVREAREVLRHALDAAARTDAAAVHARARSEMASAGGRPRREVAYGIEALSPAELRVAELAASGRTNPQIAAELFLARKTVEYHLSSIYRKLGVRSRDELARTFAR